MKMPEPRAYLWAPRKKPELAKLAFQAEPSASLKALGYVSAPLYDKQALIDLLEAAEQVCEKRSDELNTHLEKQIYGYAVVSAKDFTAGAISASKRNAAAIRKLKELL